MSNVFQGATGVLQGAKGGPQGGGARKVEKGWAVARKKQKKTKKNAAEEAEEPCAWLTFGCGRRCASAGGGIFGAGVAVQLKQLAGRQTCPNVSHPLAAV